MSVDSPSVNWQPLTTRKDPLFLSKVLASRKIGYVNRTVRSWVINDFLLRGRPYKFSIFSWLQAHGLVKTTGIGGIDSNIHILPHLKIQESTKYKIFYEIYLCRIYYVLNHTILNYYREPGPWLNKVKVQLV